MEQSILTTIKKMLGIAENYESFDLDVITNINMALMTLNQLGVGPEEGFFISDKSATWDDFIFDVTNLEGVKTYIFIKVKLVFDPPVSSFVLDALDRQAKELEWRLRAQVESNLEASSNEVLDYNTVKNKPSLDGTELKGDVRLDLANKEYVDAKTGEIEYGYY